MASRKLKAQLELDTSEARRKLRRDLSEAADGGGSGGGASRLAQSLDRVAQSADKTAQSFGQANSSALRLTRGFAGIAVGMATSYAANYMPQGQARNAVEYVGSAVSGASAGAMLGPIGAAIGGLAGVLKTYMEKNAKVEQAKEEFIKADDDYEDNRLWQKKIRDLSEIEPAAVGSSAKDANADQAKKVDERLAKVKEEAVKLFEEQNKLIERIKELLKKGEVEQANELQQQLATVRRRKEQMEALEQSYEKQKKALAREAEEIANKPEEQARASMTATDSLAKVGGLVAIPALPDAPAPSGATPSTSAKSFAFAVAPIAADTTEFGSKAEGLFDDGTAAALKTANERIEKIDSEQLRVLTEIKDTLKDTGGTTWQ